MQRCFSTVACQDLNYRQIAEYAIQAGIRAIEVRLHKGNRLFDLPENEVPEAVSYLEERGISIRNLGTGVVICDYQPEMVENAKKCVALANQVKAKGIRVFLGAFIKRFSQESGHDYDGMIKSLKEICEYAIPFGVQIWIETHNAFSTGKVLKQLLEDVNRGNLKIIWDIIHPYEFGETPEDTVAYLMDNIVHVHIKDGVKREDPDELIFRYTKLGEGELPIRKIVELLYGMGYQGMLSLEWENAWKKEIQDTFENLTEILDHFNVYMNQLDEKMEAQA